MEISETYKLMYVSWFLGSLAIPIDEPVPKRAVQVGEVGFQRSDGDPVAQLHAADPGRRKKQGI